MTNKKKKQPEVRREQTARIMSAAEQVFAENGLNGARMQEIADKAGLPKANVHYYYPTKKALYTAVLENVLMQWVEVAKSFDDATDPRRSISSYIKKKLEYSFARPEGSKVWANEVIHGAPLLGDHLRSVLQGWEKEKVRQIKRWIDAGLMLPVEPKYLLYMIWATTQHYADFEAQIQSLNRGKPLSKRQQKKVVDDVTAIILRGIGLGSQ